MQQDINDQVEANKIAEAESKILEDHSDPRFKKQEDEIIEKETKLEEIQKDTENIELINKKDEKLKQTKMNNAVFSKQIYSIIH